jgi:methionyl-tRNA formyltransferase
MRVVFWGTPEFATPSLLALLGEGHDVVAVVTQPDRPRKNAGRSRSQLDPSPTKLIALEEGIPLLQPDRPRGPEFVAQLRLLEADISVVVAYGHILPRDVIDLPPHGSINVHASLLPEYRGAAPIEAAIRDGRAETGISIVRMIMGLDAGPVILALRTPIAADETAGELHLRLAELGATAIVEALALLAVGQAVDSPQNDALATFAPKIRREDARISFESPADRVARLARAYDPRPGAWTILRGLEVRCYGVRELPGGSGQPGEVLEAGEAGLVVSCGEASIAIAEVHPAGQKRIAAAQWVRGRGVSVGDRFD